MFKKLSQPVKNYWQQGKNRSKLLPLVIILITAFVLIIFKLTQPQPPVKTQSETIWSVQTHKLETGARSPELELYARVESPYTATITSVIEADVKSLDVNEGQRVTLGQPLITLDDTDAEIIYIDRASNVAELEASIQLEKNRYKNDIKSLKLEKNLVALAEKKLAREEKTSKINLTSQSSFDTQKQALQNQKLALNARQLNVTDHSARLAQLETKLERSRALARQAKNNLTRASVLAPFDGIILKTMVSPGERVRSGETLLEMYASEKVELRAQLPQKFIPIVKQTLADKQPLYATVKTETDAITVELDRVSGSINASNHGIDALFLVDSAQANRLTIGDTLETTLKLPALDDAYSVPVSSIYGTNRIYRIEDERLVAIDVEKLGSQYQEGKQFILIRSEKLQADDLIITTQLPHALSGLKVEVHNTAIADDEPESQTELISELEPSNKKELPVTKVVP